jgi:hypothetical protein
MMDELIAMAAACTVVQLAKVEAEQAAQDEAEVEAERAAH